MKFVLVIFVAMLTITLAACGGGSQSTLIGTPLPSACPAALAVQAPVLAYPAPGASNVPVTANVLVFYSYNQPGTIPIDVQLSAGGASAVDLGLMKAAPSVIPTPTATPPTPAAANLGSVALPSLARGTAYTVVVGSPSNQCQLLGTATLGTFTTAP